MKPRLPLGVCIIISLALVIFGLFYGTACGFQNDRAQVDAILSGDEGLLNVLYFRGADGLNLCVVARRHLGKDDATISALETAAKALRSLNNALPEKKRQDDQLSAAVTVLSEKLSTTSSFTQSVRDKAYFDMLVTDMNQLSQTPLLDAYNEAAKGFNKQLSAPISGTIARFLRVKPCELYQ